MRETRRETPIERPNLRPSKYYEGVASPLRIPDNTDFVVVREGTEGLYCGNGGAVRVGTPHEI